MDYNIVYDFITEENQDIRDEYMFLIIAYFIQMFLAEVERFSDQNGIDMTGVDVEGMTADYAAYLEDILLGLYERAQDELEKITKEYADHAMSAILQLLYRYIDTQFQTIEDSETGNALQLAQLLVANMALQQFPNVKIYKSWMAHPDCCPICHELSKMGEVPIDEPFLVSGQRVDLPDGKTFIYKYVDRYVCIAHPNDRCWIEFRIEI